MRISDCSSDVCSSDLGAGADLLVGGADADLLQGGAGNDTFSGTAADLAGDTIADFAVGDSILVTGADLSSLNGHAATGTVTPGFGQHLTLRSAESRSGKDGVSTFTSRWSTYH